MPAVALTDHGSLAGAVELYARPGSRASSRSWAARSTSPTTATAQQKGYAHLTLLAESNEGYANLIKLSLARLPRGLLLQAARRLGAARAAREGARSPSPAASPAASARRSRRAARATPRPSSTGSRRSSARDPTYVEIQNAGLERAGADQPAAREARRRDAGLPLVATGDVHYLRHDGRARARGAALHPVRRLAEEPEPLEVRHRPVLLQDARRRWRSTSRGHEDAMRRTLEVAERCNVEIELGRILLPKFPTPGRPRRVRLPRRALRDGPRARYERATPELTRAARSSS